MTTDDVHVRIDMPLPLDVANTLMGVIGAVYPGAMIDTTVGYGSLSFRIPGEDRRPRLPGKKKLAALHVPEPDEPAARAQALGFDADGAVSVSPAEELTAIMLAPVRQLFEDHGDAAKNYVSWEVLDRAEPGRRWFLFAARSAQQTPHELRMKAEAEVTRLQRIVDSVAAVAAAAQEHEESGEPCDYAGEHDCHQVARYFLAGRVQAALEGNDTALRTKEKASA
jgi:hypothetical protein